MRLEDICSSPEEVQARRELACAYRLFDHFGWHELIYNHITVRVPGTEGQFLINPFGLMYREVKASNLVKIDFEGRIIGHSEHPVNLAGFVVHSAVHRARADAHAVAHTHTTAGQAVSCQKDGLLPLSFTSMFFTGQVAYHDFEGIAHDPDERSRLARDLGDKNVMILRNHGLLSCGPTIADAFYEIYQLQRACEVQIACQSTGAPLTFPSDAVARHTASQYQGMVRDGTDVRHVYGAMMRWMIDKDPSFLE